MLASSSVTVQQPNCVFRNITEVFIGTKILFTLYITCYIWWSDSLWRNVASHWSSSAWRTFELANEESTWHRKRHKCLWFVYFMLIKVKLLLLKKNKNQHISEEIERVFFQEQPLEIWITLYPSLRRWRPWHTGSHRRRGRRRHRRPLEDKQSNNVIKSWKRCKHPHHVSLLHWR